MVTHALYHRETHQQPQPQPMYLTSSTLPKQPIYQSVTPVYTGTQSGYMSATSQPNCYNKPTPESASDNADIVNNDDKQEDIEKRMNKIETSLMQLIDLFKGQQAVKGEEKESEKPEKNNIKPSGPELAPFQIAHTTDKQSLNVSFESNDNETKKLTSQIDSIIHSEALNADLSGKTEKSENTIIEASLPDVHTDATPDINEPTGGEYRDFEKNVPSSSSLLEQDTSLSQASQLTDDDASEKPQSVSKRKRGRPRKRGIE